MEENDDQFARPTLPPVKLIVRPVEESQRGSFNGHSIQADIAAVRDEIRELRVSLTERARD